MISQTNFHGQREEDSLGLTEVVQLTDHFRPAEYDS